MSSEVGFGVHMSVSRLGFVLVLLCYNRFVLVNYETIF